MTGCEPTDVRRIDLAVCEHNMPIKFGCKECLYHFPWGNEGKKNYLLSLEKRLEALEQQKLMYKSNLIDEAYKRIEALEKLEDEHQGGFETQGKILYQLMTERDKGVERFKKIEDEARRWIDNVALVDQTYNEEVDKINESLKKLEEQMDSVATHIYWAIDQHADHNKSLQKDHERLTFLGYKIDKHLIEENLSQQNSVPELRDELKMEHPLIGCLEGTLKYLDPSPKTSIKTVTIYEAIRAIRKGKIVHRLNDEECIFHIRGGVKGITLCFDEQYILADDWIIKDE